MDKKRRALLEMAFDAEVSAALNKSDLYVMQTKSKLALALVDEGMLRKVSVRLHNTPWPCTVDGYALTELGRMEYACHVTKCRTRWVRFNHERQRNDCKHAPRCWGS